MLSELVTTCKLPIGYDDLLHDDGSFRRQTVPERSLEAPECGLEVSLRHSTASSVDQEHLHRHAMGPASECLPLLVHDAVDSMSGHLEPNSEADELLPETVGYGFISPLK
jgi:hypothetical protein